ncbi:MAG: 50S ribosomal protein L24 [Candidatus Makana argininalis]
MSCKIIKNDTVIVITGKDKGKIGIVKKNHSKNRVIVNGINLVIKHKKPNKSNNNKGEIIQKESSIHISNIAIFNKQSNKLDKITFLLKNKKKIRIYKSNKLIIK